MKVIFKKVFYCPTSIDVLNNAPETTFNEEQTNQGIIESIESITDPQNLTRTVITTFSSLENYANYEFNKRKLDINTLQDEINRITFLNDFGIKITTELYITN